LGSASSTFGKDKSGGNENSAKKGATMRIIGFILCILLVAGLVLASEKDEKVYKAVIDKDGIQRVNILAGSFYFDPDYILVKVNVAVEVTIKKEAEITPHAFVIEAPEAGLHVKESLSTEPKVIKFTATKVGKYPFYCDKKFLFFKSHRERGMAGTLEVGE
jgi:plastocyanin domain-containing protein